MHKISLIIGLLVILATLYAPNVFAEEDTIEEIPISIEFTFDTPENVETPFSLSVDVMQLLVAFAFLILILIVIWYFFWR